MNEKIKEVVNNEKISLQAMGLFMIMASPENKKEFCTAIELLQYSKNNIQTVIETLNELVSAGYLKPVNRPGESETRFYII